MKKIVLIIFSYFAMSIHAGAFDPSNIKIAFVTAAACGPLIKEQWKRIEPHIVPFFVPLACGAFGVVGTRYWLNASTQSKLDQLANRQEQMHNTLSVQGYLLRSIEEKIAPLKDSIINLTAHLKKWIQSWRADSDAIKESQMHILASIEKLTQSAKETHSNSLEQIALLQKTTATLNAKMETIEQQNTYIVKVMSAIEKHYLPASDHTPVPLIENQKSSNESFWSKFIKT